MKNTLWLMVVFVPLHVLFALGVAMMLSRARRGVGVLPHGLLPPCAGADGRGDARFVYLLNPATGPVNSSSAISGSRDRSGSTRRSGRSPHSDLLGLWGIGSLMIIFLAAVIDVPRHLQESAELDGAGALRRLRYVTVPTISPVILFAVVIGVIQPPVLHAGVRGREHRLGPGLAGG